MVEVDSEVAAAVLVGVLVALAAAVLALVLLTYRGSRWGRLCTLVVLLISLAGPLIGGATGAAMSPGSTVMVGIDLLIAYALTSPSAREWTDGRGARRDRLRPRPA